MPSRSSTSRRRLIWLISLAVLWAAGWPALMPLLRGTQGGGGDWVEVCTVMGSRWVAADAGASTAIQGDRPTDDGGARMDGASCPCCLLQHQAWAPAPEVALHLQPLPRAQAALATFHASVPRWTLWPSAPPRAPPLHA